VKSVDERCSGCNDHIRSKGDHLRYIVVNTVGVDRPTDLKLGVAALDPAQLLQALTECLDPRLAFWLALVGTHQDANSRNLARRLLRSGTNRPRGGCTEQCEELASSH
jgi:hypothetical protein